jgi:transcriptional regulator with GAF, ATPase, and Fis domain
MINARLTQRAHAGATIPTGLLIVSPNDGLRKYLTSQLQSGRWRLEEAVSGAEGLEKAEAGQASIVLLDHALPDLHAEEFKTLLSLQCPKTEVVSLHPNSGEPMFAYPPAESTMLELTRDLERPHPMKPSRTELIGVDKLSRPQVLPNMVGDTPPMRQLYSMVQLVAQRDTTVLLTGETGTGKDLVARAVHELSLRKLKPFVVINCAAIPEALLEAELFGYVKGAFTGAVQSRIGRIHAAQGGTLFLDEIGDLPLGLQSKLLRFLEQGEVQRLGSTDTLRVDVRVIAATNAELRRLVQEKLFREDLFYRLSVFPICLPPLRDRQSDLAPLAHAFLRMYARRELTLTQEAMARLQSHNWPGNVRELRNVIERACILANKEWAIRPEHIIL